MEQAVAYSTLALTVTLAVSQPRLGWPRVRITPGMAALFGVLVLLLTGLLTPADMLSSAVIQWRPLVALASIMVMTGVVHEVGAFDRLADALECVARRTTPARAFTLVFAASVVTPSLLNNDAAIVLLTPLVVRVTRRLYPNDPELTVAFAFAVFLAPGVAPFFVSNPMNMIVAEFAGISWLGYSARMVPVSLACALVTFSVMRIVFGRALARARTAPARAEGDNVVPLRPAQVVALGTLVAVFLASTVVGALGGAIWVVPFAGAVASVTFAARSERDLAPRALRHVSTDILVFLWGVFLVVVGLRHVGVVDRLASLYTTLPQGSAREIGGIGGMAALGSAIVDNHPMALLNMLALGGDRPNALLAALVGGDLGPRLLPIGSLAGLLWMEILRRNGVRISVGRFVRVGVLALAPALVVSLSLLYFFRG